MRAGARAQDLRVAVRNLVRRPGFAAVALLTLAVGTGGTTAIFSIVNRVFLAPLPYPDAERIVVLYNSPRPGTRFVGFSDPMAAELSGPDGPFAAAAAFSPTRVTVGGADRPERAPGLRTSVGLAAVTGVQPELGRWFAPGEDRPGSDGVVVLGHGFWTRRFAADPSAVGRTLRVGEREREIVGVMPPGFSFFFDEAELWIPLAADPAAFDVASAVNNNRAMAARLRVGVDPAVAERETDRAMDRLREGFPDVFEAEHSIRLQRYREYRTGDLDSTLALLSGAVAVLLLIACANLANLLLVRAEGRRREFAVRAALGAGRGRLAGQLLTESAVMAVLGTAAGVVLAAGVLAVVRSLAPADVPVPGGIGLDLRVLVFVVVVAAATAVLFGLVPLSASLRTDLRSTLAHGGRGSGGGRARVRSFLVVAEVALATVLLVGSGLLVRSLLEIRRVDPGFTAADRAIADLALPRGTYGEPVEREGFLRTLVARAEALPGVAGASVAQWTPLRGAVNWGYQVEGAEEEGVRFADYDLVGPGYFRALGIPVLRGRGFEWGDLTGERPVVVVGRTMAERLWPGEDPLGRRINVNVDEPVWREVVGVVGDVRNRSLADPPGDLMYFPPVALPFASPTDLNLVVHAREGAAAPWPTLGALVAELDASVPVGAPVPLERVMRDAGRDRTFLAALLAGFASTALLLAGVGLYGVVAYSLSQRTREIGLRMALGAAASRVVGLVAGETGRLVAAGLALGLAAAWALSGLLASRLYQVSPVDPATYAGAGLFLVLVGVTAAWVPARRAVRVDPVRALRAE